MSCAAWSGCASRCNALTRMRLCTADGRIDVKMKGPPKEARLPTVPGLNTRRAYARRAGHFRPLVGTGTDPGARRRGLDTGCVWGGSLAALDLDGAARPGVRALRGPLARTPAHRDLRARRRVDPGHELEINRLPALLGDGEDHALLGTHFKDAD